MSELKTAISALIGLPVNEFKLCQNVLTKREFISGSKTLQDCKIFNGINLLVERGIPAVEGLVKVVKQKFCCTNTAAPLIYV